MGQSDGRDIGEMLDSIARMAASPEAPTKQLVAIRSAFAETLVACGLDPSDPVHGRAVALGIFMGAKYEGDRCDWLAAAMLSPAAPC